MTGGAVTPLDVFNAYSKSILNNKYPYGSWRVHESDIFELVKKDDAYYIKYLYKDIGLRPLESHPVYNRIMRCFSERSEGLFECSCGLCEKYLLALLLINRH